jgi:hypothetical protein
VSSPGAVPFASMPVLSLAQCFGEQIQVQALTPAQTKQAGQTFKRVSVSVWYDSVISQVAAAVDALHALGCAVDVKRHGDRPDPSNPYRLSYFTRPWFYSDFANRVRDGLRGHLLPGDSIEVANEPAYGAADGLDYADNVAVWDELFAGIAWDDRAAFRGIEVRGPLPNGMQPEVVTDILGGVNLSVAAFSAFDAVTAHVYPDNPSLSVATGNLPTRIGKLGAFGKWANKPVRISECGCDGRFGSFGDAKPPRSETYSRIRTSLMRSISSPNARYQSETPTGFVR